LKKGGTTATKKKEDGTCTKIDPHTKTDCEKTKRSRSGEETEKGLNPEGAK